MDSAEPGHLLAGRYRLSEVIGHGGMGVVWRARDELLDRDVAVKEVVWPANFTEHEQQTACRRATREAQMAARLNHQNVVRIYDIVEEDDHPWIVMELLPYRSLRDIVRDEGPLTPAQAAKVGLGDPRGAARRARRGHRAPGREAGEHPDRPGRPGGAHRLRHRPCRRHHDAHHRRHPDRLTLLHRPRTRPRRAVRRAGRPVGARRLAVRGGGGPPAVRARARAGDPHRRRRRRPGTGHPRGPAVAGDQRPAPQEPGRAARRRRDRAAAPPHRGLRWPTRPPRRPRRPKPWWPRPRNPHRPNSPNSPSRWWPRPSPPPQSPGRQSPGARPCLRGSPRPRRSSRSGRACGSAWAARRRVTRPPSAGRGDRRGRTGRGRGRGHRFWRCPHQLAAAPDGFAPAARPRARRPASQPERRTSTGTPRLRSATANPSTGTGAIPAGFYRFTNSTGFSIGVPDGWQISHVGHYVYITDPTNGGIFLLIDQSDNPKPDPLADWRAAGGQPGEHLPGLPPHPPAVRELPASREGGGLGVHLRQERRAGAHPEQEHPRQRPPRVRALLVGPRKATGTPTSATSRPSRPHSAPPRRNRASGG